MFLAIINILTILHGLYSRFTIHGYTVHGSTNCPQNFFK